MKRYIIISAIALAVLAVSCEEKAAPTIALEGISLNKKSVDVLKGETVQLSVIYNPENATTKPAVTWSSSKPSVATVSSTGMVTAVAKGETYIIATTEDNAFKANCLVKVTTPAYTVSIAYSGNGGPAPDVVYAYPGSSLAFKASHTDSEAHTFSWNSSNTSAVTVNDGTVTFLPLSSDNARYQLYGRSIISATTETGNSAGFEAVSSAGFTLSGETFVLGSEQQLSFGYPYEIRALYETANGSEALPKGSYSLKATNEELVFLVSGEDGYTLTAQHSEETVDVNLTIGGKTLKLFTIGKALPSYGDLEGYDEKSF